MNTNVSFRHMEASPALRDYAQSKLERIVEKYVRGKVDSSIVMSVEKFRHIANFTLQIKNLTVKGEESSQDMYSSIDLALDKIEKQLRRHKDRLRDHKPSQGQSRDFRMSVIASGAPEAFEEELEDFVDESEIEAEEEAIDEPISASPQAETFENSDGEQVAVVRQNNYRARAMRVDEAVIQLDLMGDERKFFVFTDVESNEISIIYRRDDGNFGLIET